MQQVVAAATVMTSAEVSAMRSTLQVLASHLTALQSQPPSLPREGVLIPLTGCICIIVQVRRCTVLWKGDQRYATCHMVCLFLVHSHSIRHTMHWSKMDPQDCKQSCIVCLPYCVCLHMTPSTFHSLTYVCLYMCLSMAPRSVAI